MSGLSGVGGGHHHHQVQGAAASAPATSTGATPASSSGETDPLQALQALMKQIEGSANTQAIPAHQNW